jgi:hypothetical protein
VLGKDVLEYPFVSSCSPHRLAVMQLLSTRGGKLRHRGTFTLQCMFFLMRTSSRRPAGGIPRPKPIHPHSDSGTTPLMIRGTNAAKILRNYIFFGKVIL